MPGGRELPNVREARQGEVTSGASVSGSSADLSARVPDHSLNLTERELFERLGWFISIRWFAGVLALGLVFIGWYQFSVRIPPEPVVVTICVLFLYNAVFLMLVTDAYRQQRVSQRFIVACANAQIICDLITLAVLMHFTGGVENYFLIFFICPMIIASELLSARNAYFHALLGAALINAIAWLEYAGILEHVHVGQAMGAEFYRNPVAVAKFTVALSGLLLVAVFLGSSISARLRQRERELEEAYRHLARLEESKSFLMRKTSHELRAPLNAVIAMLQVIKAETEGLDQPHFRKFVDRALHRTQALSRLITELHRFAMLKEPSAKLGRQRVNLADIVQQGHTLFTAMAQEKSITLDVHAENVHVNGDPDALAEVVGNLIVNAVQYTPDGGQVRVELRRHDAMARLEVRDTGIGIAPEAVGRIFDEFYRAPEAKKTFADGTGMGLPIVKRIVEGHGGSIHVQSKPGNGATFVVQLPVLTSGPDSTKADDPSPRANVPDAT